MPALRERLPARSPRASKALVAIAGMPLPTSAAALAVDNMNETAGVRVAVAAALGIAVVEVEVAGKVVEQVGWAELGERQTAAEVAADSAVVVGAPGDTSLDSVPPAVVCVDEAQKSGLGPALRNRSSLPDLPKAKPLVDWRSGCCGWEHIVTSLSIVELFVFLTMY